MSNSLQEQLLKAGLVDLDKVKAERKARHTQKKKGGKGGTPRDEGKQRAQQLLREKTERDRQINLKRKNKAERKAIIAQIKELILSNRLDRKDAEISFNFVEKGKVRKVLVTSEMQHNIIHGRLAIVRWGPGFELVPRDVAEKVESRDASFVVRAAISEAEGKVDDAYASFQVPDDLMW